MMIMARWRRDILVLGGTLFCGLFVWVGSRDINSSNSSSIKGYGGKLSHKVLGILEQMNGELENADGILSAQPDKILFIDGSENKKEYSYAYETLWLNDFPIVPGVRAFHFEYRDGEGNILTRCEENISTIRTVGYTIRMILDGKDVLASSKVKITPEYKYKEQQDGKQMTYVAVSMN